MRVLLAANPRSGGRTDPERIAAALRGHGAQVSSCTLAEVDAVRLADAGASRIVVAGGDGSIGVVAEAALDASAQLALVPTGTANDFARATGIPLDIGAAVRLAADPRAATKPYEVARMDGRPFVNVATAGLSVVAARAAEPLKPSLRHLAYPVGALRAGVRAQRIPTHITVDGREVFDGPAWQVAVAATGHFGGGSATGGTNPHDRLLDVVVVRDDSRLMLARRAAGMRMGRLVDQRGVLTVRGGRAEVTGPRAYNVDGELCSCGAGGARFEMERRRLEVVVGG